MAMMLPKKEYVFLKAIIVIIISLSVCYIGLKISAKPKRSKVDFSHTTHIEYGECLNCHHKYNEKEENILDAGDLGENQEPEQIVLGDASSNSDNSCSSCHNSKAEINLQKAFHKQCIKCHEKQGKGFKRGPVLCGECHT